MISLAFQRAIPRLLRAPAPLRSWVIRESYLRSSRSQLAPLGRRYASTGSEQSREDTRSLVTRLKNLFLGTSIILTLSLGYLYITDTRASVHQWIVIPVLRWIYPDPEDAHEAGNAALKALYTWGLHPRERGNPDAAGDLKTEVFGYTLSNPIGTSAGIDKNAEIPSPLLALGPAIIEVGGVTPHPQEGNARPRVFRLPSQNALINRYGLNSEGADFVAMRLRQRLREFAYREGFGLDEDAEKLILDGAAGVPPGSLTKGKLLAVQVAKNKFTPDSDIKAVTNDYTTCVDMVGKYADILVVNVSSPNTPGLRSLQRVEPLTAILTGVVQAAKSLDRKTKPAVMVKVSPDEDSEEQVTGICEAVWESGVDGVIVGNTTKRRPDPLPQGFVLPARELNTLSEIGGYSGPQLFERTVKLVARYRKLLDERPQQNPVLTSSKSKQAPTSQTSTENPEESVVAKIEASTERDAQRLKPLSDDRSSAPQPLLQLPTQSAISSKSPEDSRPTPTVDAPVPEDRPKTIFATGGITNGKQALEVLNAGANVAQVYTAMVYSGASTISRIKQEMRNEIKQTTKS
ncbi:MAG: Dihydroorotate dehydrogenase (quinone), mitochondrial [Bogoriella megaspora]|nr:MAG: Dihydroorotate dehydrogenase (quinone), mitochondrial [Bogoriella megaspora]